MQRSPSGLSSGVVVKAKLASEVPGLLDPPLALRREGRPAPIRRMGDQRGSGFAIDDCYRRAPIPIDLVVLLAAQSSLIGGPFADGPSARHGPWSRGAPIYLFCRPLDRVDLLRCEHRTLTLFPLERSERRVAPISRKVRMAVGCPGDLPPFGVGASSLRRRGRDDARRRGCTKNGEKYHHHTIAHFTLQSSGIHGTDRLSYQEPPDRSG